MRPNETVSGLLENFLSTVTTNYIVQLKDRCVFAKNGFSSLFRHVRFTTLKEQSSARLRVGQVWSGRDGTGTGREREERLSLVRFGDK